MLDMTALEKVKYVVDSSGNKAAVQVDINLWGDLLNYLEDLEDRSLIKDKLARLREGPEKSSGISWQDASKEW
jgi:predicted DNA-binding protein